MKALNQCPQVQYQHFIACLSIFQYIQKTQRSNPALQHFHIAYQGPANEHFIVDIRYQNIRKISRSNANAEINAIEAEAAQSQSCFPIVHSFEFNTTPKATTNSYRTHCRTKQKYKAFSCQMESATALKKTLFRAGGEEGGFLSLLKIFKPELLFSELYFLESENL